MQVPEWDFFKRIENLEEKIKDIEGQVPPDMLLPIALVGLIYGFIAFSLHSPKYVRKWKDDLLSTLREGGLGNEVPTSEAKILDVE